MDKRSSEHFSFVFADFVWLSFNSVGFFYVLGNSNVRTVGDNEDIRTGYLGIKHNVTCSVQNSVGR